MDQLEGFLNQDSANDRRGGRSRSDLACRYPTPGQGCARISLPYGLIVGRRQRCTHNNRHDPAKKPALRRAFRGDRRRSTVDRRGKHARLRNNRASRLSRQPITTSTCRNTPRPSSSLTSPATQRTPTSGLRSCTDRAATRALAWPRWRSRNRTERERLLISTLSSSTMSRTSDAEQGQILDHFVTEGARADD